MKTLCEIERISSESSLIVDSYVCLQDTGQIFKAKPMKQNEAGSCQNMEGCCGEIRHRDPGYSNLYSQVLQHKL